MGIGTLILVAFAGWINRHQYDDIKLRIRGDALGVMLPVSPKRSKRSPGHPFPDVRER